MRANTLISMALNHIGVKGSKTEVWTGTFAECVTHLAKHLGGVSMATRFDLSIARTPEEAKKGVMERTRKITALEESFALEDLAALMNESSAEGAVNGCEVCGGLNTSCPKGCERP